MGKVCNMNEASKIKKSGHMMFRVQLMFVLAYYIAWCEMIYRGYLSSTRFKKADEKSPTSHELVYYLHLCEEGASLLDYLVLLSSLLMVVAVAGLWSTRVLVMNRKSRQGTAAAAWLYGWLYRWMKWCAVRKKGGPLDGNIGKWYEQLLHIVTQNERCFVGYSDVQEDEGGYSLPIYSSREVDICVQACRRRVFEVVAAIHARDYIAGAFLIIVITLLCMAHRYLCKVEEESDLE